MPVSLFVGLLVAVVAAAGLTIVLAFWAGLPVGVLGLLALLASLGLLWRRRGTR